MDIAMSVVVVVTVIGLVCLVLWLVLSSSNNKKTILKQKNDDSLDYNNHALHRAWQDKVNFASRCAPENFNVSVVGLPPESIGGHEGEFNQALWRYEKAKEAVAEASAYITLAKLIVDPLEQRDSLYKNRSDMDSSLSPQDYQWVKDRVLEISQDQVAELWIKTQNGDSEARSKLIIFTGEGTYLNYYRYTGMSWPTPDGWLDMISRYFREPTLDLLRTRRLGDSTLLLLTATALRESSIIKAKIVLAHWWMNQTYQLLIPQEMIADLVKMVDFHHSQHSTKSRMAE